MSGTCACRRSNTPEGIASAEVDFGINFASVLVTGLDHGVEMSSDPPNAKSSSNCSGAGQPFSRRRVRFWH